MKLLRIFPKVFFLIGVLSVGNIAAQQPPATPAKPNLSGEWLLECQKDAGGNLTQPCSSIEVRLHIRHEGPEVQVVQERTADGKTTSQTLVYFTDGRGEKNSAAGLMTRSDAPAKVEIKSRTSWKKDRLLVRGFFRQNLGGRSLEVEQIDEWQLIDGGKGLVHKTVLKLDPVSAGFAGGGRAQPIVVSPPPAVMKRTFHLVK